MSNKFKYRDIHTHLHIHIHTYECKYREPAAAVTAVAALTHGFEPAPY